MRNFFSCLTVFGYVVLAVSGCVLIIDAVRRVDLESRLLHEHSRRIREESGRMLNDVRASMQIFDRDSERIREEMELFARALHARDEKMTPQRIVRQMGADSIERPVAMDDADTKQMLVVHNSYYLAACDWAWTAMVALVSVYIGMRVGRYQ